MKTPKSASLLNLWSLYHLHSLTYSESMHLNSLETKAVQRDTHSLSHEMTWIAFLALLLTYFVTLSKLLYLCAWMFQAVKQRL